MSLSASCFICCLSSPCHHLPTAPISYCVIEHLCHCLYTPHISCWQDTRTSASMQHLQLQSTVFPFFWLCLQVQCSLGPQPLCHCWWKKQVNIPCSVGYSTKKQLSTCPFCSFVWLICLILPQLLHLSICNAMTDVHVCSVHFSMEWTNLNGNCCLSLTV